MKIFKPFGRFKRWIATVVLLFIIFACYLYLTKPYIPIVRPLPKPAHIDTAVSNEALVIKRNKDLGERPRMHKADDHSRNTNTNSAFDHDKTIKMNYQKFHQDSSRSSKNHQDPSRRRPNIVFILADDLGYNDVGYHNKKEIYTPTIDKLAREGVTLENYYVQPICSPSRMQFMSGKKLIHTGVVHRVLKLWQPYGLPLNSATLADKLSDAGYVTDMVGKWHIGFYQEEYLPTRRGFETFYGYYSGNSDHYTHEVCDSGWCMLDLHNDTVKKRKLDRKQRNVYSTHLYTDEAIRVINKRSKDRSKGDNPFFLYLSYQAVHGPLQVPKNYIEKVGVKLGKVSEDKRRKTFIGMTYAMDRGIARVVDALKKNGVWDNTILIFSTDNGGVGKNGGSNLPLKGEKFTFYEGGIRAVGFVNSPLLQKTGYINTELIHITDWFSTFIHLANGDLNGTSNLDSFDQWDTISRGYPSPRKEILYNIDPIAHSRLTRKEQVFKHQFNTAVLGVLRKGDYKIITGLAEPPGVALYNVKEDPLEKKELAKKEKYRSKVMEMLDALLAHQATAVPIVFRAGDAPTKKSDRRDAVEPGMLQHVVVL